MSGYKTGVHCLGCGAKRVVSGRAEDWIEVHGDLHCPAANDPRAPLNPDDVEIAARALHEHDRIQAINEPYWIGLAEFERDSYRDAARSILAALAAAGRLREPLPADVQDVVDETVARWRAR